MGLFKTQSNFIGVDIGSTAIKIVELKKDANLIKLVNYGFTENSDLKPANWLNTPERSAEVINKICQEAGIQSVNAISALPTFSVFSSVITLTNVAKKDLPAAINWEAKKLIPLPLEDMILDWKIIEHGADDAANTRVLLTGAPRSLVKKYIDIFKLAKISLSSLETETFSLVRSLIGNDKSTVMIVEIGATTTDVSIVDRGIPMLSRSIDIGGLTVTEKLSDHLGIGQDRAEQFKYDLGVSQIGSVENEIPKTVMEIINPIINEIKYAINLFLNKSGNKTEKVILSGGSSLIPNLANYLSGALDMKVIIGDPWNRVSFHPDMKPLLSEIGPRMSVAIGLAIRELE